MFDKLKNTLKDIQLNKDDDKSHTPLHAPSPLPPQQLLINQEELKNWRKLLDKIQQNTTFIAEIAENNRSSIAQYIREQQEKITQNDNNKPESNADEDESQEFTIKEDMAEIIELLRVVQDSLRKVEKVQEARATGGPAGTDPRVLARYEEEIKRLKQNSVSQQQIMETMKQQVSLFQEETRKLQEKIVKLEKELGEKNVSITNLQEEKKTLISLSNAPSSEVEGLRNQIQEFEKRLNLEKSKLTQKQKEVETLKKKVDEERTSLQSMADELKEKELKSKKMTDKYEKSKAEVRKYRQEKTEQIKSLQQEVAAANEQKEKFRASQEALQTQVAELKKQLEEARSRYDVTVSGSIHNANLQQELKNMEQTVRELQEETINKDNKIEDLQRQCGMLQQKRQALLGVLEKPIQHEIKTLQSLHKQIEGLYKCYIIQVFEKGERIAYERKIMAIMENIQELKEDLLL